MLTADGLSFELLDNNVFSNLINCRNGFIYFDKAVR